MVSAGANLIGQAVSGGKINWKSVGASAAEGAIVGGVAGLTFGNPIAVGLASAAGNAVKQGINKGFDKIDVGEVVISGAVGFVSAGISGVATKAIGKIANSALSTVGKKIAGALAGGVSEAVADAVAQGINLATGRQESWNWEQTGTSFGMGMITGYSQTRGELKRQNRVDSNSSMSSDVQDPGVGKYYETDNPNISTNYDPSIDTRSSLKRGRDVHKDYSGRKSEGYTGKKTKTLNNGKRPDFIDWNTNTVYELKPNNKLGYTKGMNQLQGYIDQLNTETATSDWRGILDFYE